eukprot:6200971-Pleurochrysis_carterae.AAC.2
MCCSLVNVVRMKYEQVAARRVHAAHAESMLMHARQQGRATCTLERCKSELWSFGLASSVSAAGFQERLRDGLDHQTLRDGNGAEQRHLARVQQAAVRVRQQARLLEHEPAHRRYVTNCRVVTEQSEMLCGCGPTIFGPVAEGEERLSAASISTVTSDLKHLLRGKVCIADIAHARVGSECAISTRVSAETRERNEHLAGVGDK